jgi:hypothetical protein
MNIIYNLFRRHNAFAGQNSNEIRFLKVTIDIVRDIAAFRRNYKLFSFEVFLIDQEVERCVYHLLRFAVAVKGTSVDDIDSSRFYSIDYCSKHLVVIVVCWWAIVCSQAQ